MQPLPSNPRLYEINTRVWLNRFATASRRATFRDVPDAVWDDLADKGIDIIWLMGVWRINPSTVEKYDFRDELLTGYQRALPDWRREDVIGSPFAIDDYVLNATLGTVAELATVREALHARGMRLMLDFVPNHFSADSWLIGQHPEIFLPGNEDLLQRDEQTFYRADATQQVFAHGRDPYFPAWPDTVQINYFSTDACAFMTRCLLQMAQLCDGLRCDMAMLILNDVFRDTWGEVLAATGYREPRYEFWKDAIAQVKARYPGFVFMGEAYWDREWVLQQLGFDYTYDKKLTDRLHSGNVEEVRLHLMADPDYQAHSVRFLENHDETRALAAFGKTRSLAAAVIISTIPGLRFYNDGQFEGKQVRLPVQLGREAQEPIMEDVQAFYRHLLGVTHTAAIIRGHWQQVFPMPAWEGNDSHHHLLAWLWRHVNERCLVVVNYSATDSQARLTFDVSDCNANIAFNDVLNHQVYMRGRHDIAADGLYVALGAYQSHIFAY
jgi:glycosidase